MIKVGERWIRVKLARQTLLLTEQEILSNLPIELHALAIMRGKKALRDEMRRGYKLKLSTMERREEDGSYFGE
jgi:hypothetical protein